MIGRRMKTTKYVVMLRETPDKQIWLGHDMLRRIGNARYDEAFRFNSEHHAKQALKLLPHKWPEAKVLATLEDSDER